jgi:single-strand DNA-binding protein
MMPPAKPGGLREGNNLTRRVPRNCPDSEADRGITMSLNKVMIIGRLGRDPEIRYTAIGMPVVNFLVETEEPYFDEDGKRQERTEWHRVVVVAKIALICHEHLKRGQQVYVEGRLHTSQFETKLNGRKQSRTEIVATRVQFLDAPSGEIETVMQSGYRIKSIDIDG